jgi:uncharacterized RDD family membrane protein YckC
LAVAFLAVAFLAVAFLAVAFLAVAFLAVAFLAVAFLAVAFLAVAFLAVAFFAVAFFAGTVTPRSAITRLVSLITSFKDTSGKRRFKRQAGLFARGGDGRSSPWALISSDEPRQELRASPRLPEKYERRANHEQHEGLPRTRRRGADRPR